MGFTDITVAVGACLLVSECSPVAAYRCIGTTQDMAVLNTFRKRHNYGWLASSCINNAPFEHRLIHARSRRKCSIIITMNMHTDECD